LRQFLFELLVGVELGLICGDDICGIRVRCDCLVGHFLFLIRLRVSLERRNASGHLNYPPLPQVDRTRARLPRAIARLGGRLARMMRCRCYPETDRTRKGNKEMAKRHRVSAYPTHRSCGPLPTELPAGS